MVHLLRFPPWTLGTSHPEIWPWYRTSPLLHSPFIYAITLPRVKHCPLVLSHPQFVAAPSQCLRIDKLWYSEYLTLLPLSLPLFPGSVILFSVPPADKPHSRGSRRLRGDPRKPTEQCRVKHSPKLSKTPLFFTKTHAD